MDDESKVSDRPEDSQNVGMEESYKMDVIERLQQELSTLHVCRQQEQDELLRRLQALEAKEFQLIHFVEQSKHDMNIQSDLLQKAKGAELLLAKRLDEAILEHEDEIQSIQEAYQDLLEKTAGPKMHSHVIRTRVARLQASMAETAKAMGLSLSWSPPSSDEEIENEFLEMEGCMRQIASVAAERAKEVVALKEQAHAAQLAYDEMHTRFVSTSEERRQLHNLVMDLKGAVRVVCRCRPLIGCEEKTDWDVQCDEVSNTVDVFAGRVRGCVVNELEKNDQRRNSFSFDKVFGSKADQRTVYLELQPLITSIMDGYNVCILAYGQTRSGKTFTMQGTPSQPGVSIAALDDLFSRSDEQRANASITFRISMFEVHNDSVYDLLPAADPAVGTGSPPQSSPGVSGVLSGSMGGRGSSSKLDSMKGQTKAASAAGGVKKVVKSGTNGAYVEGLIEREVANAEQAKALLAEGADRRRVSETAANRESSRSHCLVCINVRVQRTQGTVTESKLWLVDLAGSERNDKSQAVGERLKEAQYINSSLSSLVGCITALRKRAPHVPFRNTHLTHLLQDSLSGGSKVMFLIGVNPTAQDSAESLCSLNFAKVLRGLELGTHGKNSPDMKHLQAQLASSQAGYAASQTANDSLTEQVFQLQEYIACHQDELEKYRADAEVAAAAYNRLQLELSNAHAAREAAEADKDVVEAHNRDDFLRAKALEGELMQAIETSRAFEASFLQEQQRRQQAEALVRGLRAEVKEYRIHGASIAQPDTNLRVLGNDKPAAKTSSTYNARTAGVEGAGYVDDTDENARPSPPAWNSSIKTKELPRAALVPQCTNTRLQSYAQSNSNSQNGEAHSTPVKEQAFERSVSQYEAAVDVQQQKYGDGGDQVGQSMHSTSLELDAQHATTLDVASCNASDPLEPPIHEVLDASARGQAGDDSSMGEMTKVGAGFRTPPRKHGEEPSEYGMDTGTASTTSLLASVYRTPSTLLRNNTSYPATVSHRPFTLYKAALTPAARTGPALRQPPAMNSPEKSPTQALDFGPTAPIIWESPQPFHADNRNHTRISPTDAHLRIDLSASLDDDTAVGADCSVTVETPRTTFHTQGDSTFPATASEAPIAAAQSQNSHFDTTSVCTTTSAPLVPANPHKVEHHREIELANNTAIDSSTQPCEGPLDVYLPIASQEVTAKSISRTPGARMCAFLSDNLVPKRWSPRRQSATILVPSKHTTLPNSLSTKQHRPDPRTSVSASGIYVPQGTPSPDKSLSKLNLSKRLSLCSRTVGNRQSEDLPAQPRRRESMGAPGNKAPLSHFNIGNDSRSFASSHADSMTSSLVQPSNASGGRYGHHNNENNAGKDSANYNRYNAPDSASAGVANETQYLSRAMRGMVNAQQQQESLHQETVQLQSRPQHLEELQLYRSHVSASVPPPNYRQISQPTDLLTAATWGLQQMHAGVTTTTTSTHTHTHPNDLPLVHDHPIQGLAAIPSAAHEEYLRKVEEYERKRLLGITDVPCTQRANRSRSQKAMPRRGSALKTPRPTTRASMMPQRPVSSTTRKPVWGAGATKATK